MLTQWAHFRLFRARSSPLLSKNLTHACERFLRPHTPVSRGSLRWSTPGGRVADKEKHVAPAQTTREIDIRPDTWQTALLPWGKNFSPGKARGHGWRKRLFSSPGERGGTSNRLRWLHAYPCAPAPKRRHSLRLFRQAEARLFLCKSAGNWHSLTGQGGRSCPGEYAASRIDGQTYGKTAFQVSNLRRRCRKSAVFPCKCLLSLPIFYQAQTGKKSALEHFLRLLTKT